jgi:hypothetical protein
MIVTCLILFLFLSFKSFANECDTSKGKLEMSFGNYQFKTIQLCKNAHKMAHDCNVENLERARKSEKNLVPLTA